ncbi:MAG: DNA repair protein RadC [Pseudomonadota bacterium]
MKIMQWPRQERPREKLLQFGAQNLSDAELLAIFIQCGVKGESALDIAKRLLTEFGSLRKLLNSPRNRVIGSKGLGSAKYALLQASIEMNRRALLEVMVKEQSFSSAEDASLFLQQHLREKQREVFTVLMLDSQHQLITIHDMFYGTINAATVYPREIVKQALEDNAASVILAHNHPSGHPEPSTADQQITQRIVDALSLVDISVLDHFVIGDGTAVSFAQRGLL